LTIFDIRPFFSPLKFIYSLGPGAVHIPPIRPTKIAKMNIIPIGSEGIKPGDVY
jgi:hypothetical protein